MGVPSSILAGPPFSRHATPRAGGGAAVEPSAPTDWATVLRAEGRRLAALAMLHAESPEAAEELLQEVMCALVTRQAAAEDPLAYAARAIRHAAALRVRQRRAAERALVARAAVARTSVARVWVDGTGSIDQPRPGQAPESLATALESLADVQRDVLLLRIKAGLTFAQIATVLEASPNTVASHYRRALSRLRSALHKEVDP